MGICTRQGIGKLTHIDTQMIDTQVQALFREQKLTHIDTQMIDTQVQALFREQDLTHMDFQHVTCNIS